MKFSKILTPLLLIFALLMTQGGSFAHGISHTLSEQSQDQNLAQDKLCDLCAAYAQIGTAIHSSPFDLKAGQAISDHLLGNAADTCSIPLVAFSARAPPTYLIF